MPDFPSHPADITADWLTDRLRAAGVIGAGSITAISWEAIGTGQVGDSARLHLTYDCADGGPASVVGKFPAADETSRATATAFGLYRKEVGFYRELHHMLDVRVPIPHVAESDADGADFVLIFEDLLPERGGNQLQGCTLEDARAAVRQAAALHAPSWDNSAITEADWLKVRPKTIEMIKALYGKAQTIFAERYSGILEPEYMAVCARLGHMHDLWIERDSGVKCLIHGDFRLDNMLFGIHSGSEAIAVLDWQTVAVGNALTDLGYFMGCGIGPELRRAHEAELLELYCAEMTGRGVTLTVPEIWDDYCIGALHGVSTAVFSSAYVERTPRGDENFLSMARGACDLALEHHSLEILRKAG